MSQENLEIVRKSVAAFAAGDIDALEKAYKPEASITTFPEGWPEAGPFEGREAVILQFIRLQEDWKEHSLEIEREVAGRDWVVLAFRWQMQGAGSGMTLDTNVVGAYRIEGGLIAEARFFWKWKDALQAVGLSELDAHADS